MTVATWLHLAGLHLDIDPEYEVTSDLASQHPTCVNQKVLRREVVFIASVSFPFIKDTKRPSYVPFHVLFSDSNLIYAARLALQSTLERGFSV